MIALLQEQEPHHPYVKLGKEQLSGAFSELVTTLKKHGLVHSGYDALNHSVLTPFGTVHPSYRLPLGLKANAAAFKSKPASLILDFKGLREFSARFFCEMLKKQWPKLSARCMVFPDMQRQSEVFTPFMARSMENPNIQDAFIKKIKPLLKGKSCLGVPAILGVESSEAIRQRLESSLGISVFEIPTSPVSVPGSRLKEALARAIENTSVTRLFNQRVTEVLRASDSGFECLLGTGQTKMVIRSNAVVLASGRFLSKGLVTKEYRIKEPLFDLFISQPENRDFWHAKDYFNPCGHLINRVGLETDSLFRPLDPDNGVAYRRLYAAGSILAYQDWVRTKCGSGLAIGTAYGAVKSYLQNR